MERLKHLWRRYAAPFWNDDTSKEQVLALHLFTLAGALSLAVFGPVRYFGGDRIGGSVELIFGILIFANLGLLRLTRNLEQAASILLLLLAALLSELIITGGIGGTGILWFSTFPLLALFLKGRRSGLLWLLAMLIWYVSLVFLQFTGLFHLAYSTVYLRQAAGSFLCQTMLVYFYAEVNERIRLKVSRHNAEMETTNRSLGLEVQARKNAEAQLRGSVRESERQNTLLQDSRNASISLLEDLAEAKMQAEQRQANDEALLGSIGDGVVAIDRQGLVSFANGAFGTLFGKDPKELIGKRWGIDIPQEVDGQGVAVKPDRTAAYQAMASGTKISTDRYRCLLEGGRWAPVLITAAPTMVKGEITGAVLLFRDITHEKQIDQAKTEFVSLASHQLRTPLSAINWYSEMLLNGDAGPLKPQQRKYMQEIDTGNKRMVALINALLNVSRIDLGTFSVDPSPMRIEEIADSVLGELEPLIKSKGLHLKKAYGKELPVMNADPKLIRILLQNLLSNACKYTPAGGKVSLSLAYDHRQKVVSLTVADSGYGIPAGQQDKIFTKLFRADNVTRMDTEGTGLGMYIVKSIVEQAGGTIWFTSKEDHGSTFYINLPLEGMSAGNLKDSNEDRGA